MAEWIVEIGDVNPHIKSMKELVRCKDCKHLHNFNLASGTELPNKFYCGSMTESGRYKQVKLDDFCAWGEKDE